MAKAFDQVAYKSPDGRAWSISRFYKGTIDALFAAYGQMPAGQFGPGGANAWTTLFAQLRGGNGSGIAYWDSYQIGEAKLQQQRMAVNATHVAQVLGVTRDEILAIFTAQQSLWAKGTQPSEPSNAIGKLCAAKLPKATTPAQSNANAPAAASGTAGAVGQAAVPASSFSGGGILGSVQPTTIAAVVLVVVGGALAWWAWKQ